MGTIGVVVGSLSFPAGALERWKRSRISDVHIDWPTFDTAGTPELADFDEQTVAELIGDLVSGWTQGSYIAIEEGDRTLTISAALVDELYGEYCRRLATLVRSAVAVAATGEVRFCADAPGVSSVVALKGGKASVRGSSKIDDTALQGKAIDRMPRSRRKR